MTQINLLPWREAARKQKKAQFGIICGMAFGVTVVFIIFLHIYFSGLVATENMRIAFIQTAVSAKQAEYVAQREQKKKQLKLESEFTYINSLKEKSFGAVRALTELVKQIPKNITLEEVMRENNILTLQGKAEAELQITQLLKNLSQSQVFVHPILTHMSEKPVKGEAGRIFEIQVEIKGTAS